MREPRSSCHNAHAVWAVRAHTSYSRAYAKEPDGRLGWYKCAVLPAEGVEPGSRLSSTLESGDITLNHTQCITCFRAATRGCAMSCSGG